jgi:hypothetical protein
MRDARLEERALVGEGSERLLLEQRPQVGGPARAVGEHERELVAGTGLHLQHTEHPPSLEQDASTPCTC